MPAPTRQRPTTSPLAVRVESINPAVEPAPTALVPVQSGKPGIRVSGLADDGKEARKRSFIVPLDTIARAQQAQKISDVTGGGYSSLNALVVGAIENEIRRIEVAHNQGRTIHPLGGDYRRGRPTGD